MLKINLAFHSAPLPCPAQDSPMMKAPPSLGNGYFVILKVRATAIVVWGGGPSSTPW